MKRFTQGSRLSPEEPVSPSRRDFIKKTSIAALAAVAAPALLTKYARSSERPIKIGYVTPRTGFLASFTEPDDYVFKGVQKAFANGITVAGKNHPVEILRKDSRSDPNRTAEVAAALIKSDKVDIMLGAHTGDTCNPVADQCEINGVPCCTGDCPVEAYFFGRNGNPAKPFQWTYHFFWGDDELADVYSGIWNSISTNRTVASLFPNDNDGRAVAQIFPPLLKAKGFKLIDLGRFDIQTNDYSGQISRFKEAKAEIVTGVLPPPAFSTFWQQAAQQGFKPKICTMAKASLFPAAVASFGARGLYQTTEIWWSPFHPFKSSLTGQSSAQFCAEWEKQTGKQWTQPMGFEHALYEVAYDTLKRARSLSPEDIRDALRTTNFNTIVGPMRFAERPIPNVCRTPLVGGQWVRGKKYPYELEVIFNGTYPSIPKNGTLRSLA
jgi:branched-chain amino acid transport system substrate-binding protein